MKRFLCCAAILASCAIKPSQKYGIHKKYAVDSIEVNLIHYSNIAYVLKAEALLEMDSLIHPTYEGTEDGRHFFINWSKVTIEPFSINHFALDTSLCQVEAPMSRSEENHRLSSSSRPRSRKAGFKKGRCSVSAPKIRPEDGLPDTTHN